MGTIEYWENEEGDYYWHLEDSNGEIVADGSEGYDSESNVERAIDNVIDEMENPSVEEVDKDDVDDEDRDRVE
jgi:uncharacterized protein YegP (UPF0339 family)